MRILELSGCYIVLGVDWMRTVTSLTFDFNKLEVIVVIEGNKLTLSGSLEQGECKLIGGKRLQKMILKKGGQIAQLYSIQAMEMESDSQSKIELQPTNASIDSQLANKVCFSEDLHSLLVEFKDLFMEPTSLPP